MAQTATIKVPPALKSRIAKVAEKSGRTPHAFMLAALERETAREERVEELVSEALAADAEIDAGGAIYAAEDVHAWIERLAAGKKPKRPRSSTKKPR